MDMVERFLLHFFTVSAHGYTRGTWTTPESSNVADRSVPRRPSPTVPYSLPRPAWRYPRILVLTPSHFGDRSEPTIPYASTGIHTVPIYLKWMLVFEEPETRMLHTRGVLSFFK